MTADELKALDAQIAQKREQREALNQQAVAAKGKARALSAEIRELEARLPAPKVRHAIVMSVESAKVAAARKR